MNGWESHRVMSMEVACCPRTSWRAASPVLIGLNRESVTHLLCALECSTECKILIMLMRVSWDFVQTYRPLKLCNWWFRDRSSSSRRGDRFAVTNNFEDAVLQDGGGKHAVIGSWTKSSKTNRPIMSSRSAAYWLWNRLQFRCAIVTSFRAVGTSQLLSIIDLPKQGNQERRTRV
jgi:hypothetical protein